MGVPSAQEIVAGLRRMPQQQATLKTLAQHFGVSVRERRALREHIRELVAQGQVIRLRSSRYGLPDRQQTLVGTVRRHADGYGFVAADAAQQDDVYIPASAMGGVMHADRVVVKLDPGGARQDRRSGRVVQVLERRHQEVVGHIETAGKAWVVIPADPRLCPSVFLPPRDRGMAQPGQVVVAEIRRFGLGQEHPHGWVREVLGVADDPDMAVRLVMYAYGLPECFAPEVESAAAAIPQDILPEVLAGRYDLRHLVTVTIDSETARDFDDAVSWEPLGRGRQRIGVHIADVSHYVREGSPLDREAYARGTSVYFPDRVIPMLPARLSHEVCCLQPQADRLTLSIFIEMTDDAEVVQHEIVEAVIRSQARLTYTAVASHLDGNGAALAGYHPALAEVLVRLNQVATRLREKRQAAGSIDFDLPDSDIILDRAGKIERILRAERNQAHRLIEECMLLANRTVAAHLAGIDVPTLYRVHEPPTRDDMNRFNACMQAFGQSMATVEGVQPRQVQAVLAAVAGTPAEPLVHHLLLRAMQRAHYAADNTGHFGLAFPYYTHFTSPIRRYPDLIVHRIVRDTLQAGGMSAARRAYWERHVAEIATSTSACERRADEAEREVVNLKKVEFMQDKVGMEYDGVITGVTHFGIFVELVEVYVEGMVPVARLAEPVRYQEQQSCLVGQRTGRMYRLGDRVRVRVESVNVARRQLEFAMLPRRDKV